MANSVCQKEGARLAIINDEDVSSGSSFDEETVRVGIKNKLKNGRRRNKEALIVSAGKKELQPQEQKEKEIICEMTVSPVSIDSE